MRRAYSASERSPRRRSRTVSSIQPESRNRIFPCSGMLWKWRFKKGQRFSSGVGMLTLSTRKKRGSSSRMSEWMVLPFPAAPQPSIRTITGSLASLMRCCRPARSSLRFLSSFLHSSVVRQSTPKVQSFNTSIDLPC